MLFVTEDNRKASSVAQVSKPPQLRVLIGDDQHDVLTALSLLLKLNNYATRSVDSPAGAISAVREDSFDLIVIDLNYSRDTTSGQEGLELLCSLRNLGVVAPIVVMTAWGNVELAVEAMRLGANDFIQKPWDNQRLLTTLSKQLERADTIRRQELQARSELEIARHVQQKLLPQQLSPLSRLEYAAACLPAREVGGDYYDFFDIGPGRMAGLLADVSGKGVAAAMLMASLQACFRTQLDAGARSSITLLETVNRLFYASSPLEQYVTLFYFEYDDAQRSLRYINCGHLAPALLKSDGTVTRLHATGTVVGLFPELPCESGEIVLKEKEVLVLFTDGVTELLDGEGNEFGDDRFIALSASVRHLSPSAAIRHVTDRLATVRGDRDQHDDQTIVWFKAR